MREHFLPLSCSMEANFRREVDGGEPKSGPYLIFNKASSRAALASSTLSCPDPVFWISRLRNFFARTRKAILKRWPRLCLYKTAVSMIKSWDIRNAIRSFSKECPTRTVSLCTSPTNSS
ncbi:Os12g0189100 [Oryza sativa Japonica Group]|uniref:Os12g0189100 protein n=1 Tax=Oryza sativa subsp. japonica TaxID=39947 RepID=A0A0P0Y8C3_ORYSJ|nr:hypothetical protein EE612_058209 [Oryza sativa]BAT16192.1 Os12g0189100 [Oryza sativa Japonica Group]